MRICRPIIAIFAQKCECGRGCALLVRGRIGVVAPDTVHVFVNDRDRNRKATVPLLRKFRPLWLIGGIGDRPVRFGTEMLR